MGATSLHESLLKCDWLDEDKLELYAASPYMWKKALRLVRRGFVHEIKLSGAPFATAAVRSSYAVHQAYEVKLYLDDSNELSSTCVCWLRYTD